MIAVVNMINLKLQLLAQYRTYHYRRESEGCAVPTGRLTVKELIELVNKKT